MRSKAQVVENGFTQIEGTDFQEVYSPVSRYVTVRLVMSGSVKKKYKRPFLDVKNAFVNATLKEAMYVSQHDGLV